MDRREFLACSVGFIAFTAAYLARFGERNMAEFERRMDALDGEKPSDEGRKERKWQR